MVLISNMGIVFSNSYQEIPKYDIFGPKFRNFQFYTKVLNDRNSNVLKSNMTIFFQNPYSKIHK